MDTQQKNTLREIVESVAYIVLGMVLAAAAYGILGAVLQTSNPVVTVVSDSMIPTLYRGDLLVLKGVPVSELKAGRPGGDIIVYYYAPASKLIVHRIWKINSDGTINTWGDNNSNPDPWPVQPDWVRGKMVLRVPYLGYPRLWIRDILRY